MIFDKKYWSDRWINEQTGWDIGEISPALKYYIDQLQDKEIGILIPGCGNGYEAEYLWSQGFHNTYVIDIAEKAVMNLKARVSTDFHSNIILGDFFDHQENYDLILEQTFFCTLPPNDRPSYVEKMHALLNTGGRLVGLLFSIPLYKDHPPFGGTKEDYIPIFNPYFEVISMEISDKSIKPRLGNEYFFEMEKRMEN